MSYNFYCYFKNIACVITILLIILSIVCLRDEKSWIPSPYQALEILPFQRLIGPPRSISNEDSKLLEILNQRNVEQNNSQLVKIIRDYFIHPPSLDPYHLDSPELLDHSRGQAAFVDNRLNFRESGFYVECGALDGEKRSNTLFFERFRNWNGLLIEADPDTFKELLSKNRKALTMNACLSPDGYPAQLKFNKGYNRGRLMYDNTSLEWIKRKRIPEKFITVQCLPFYSILLAIGQIRIDFFSLDIEGEELSVLKTIPWDRVDIRMLTVEFVHDVGNYRGIQTYMESVGYETLIKMQRDDNTVNDLIFKKKD